MSLSYNSIPANGDEPFSAKTLQVEIQDDGNVSWNTVDVFVTLPGESEVQIFTRTGVHMGMGLNGWSFSNISESAENFLILFTPPNGGFPVDVTTWRVHTDNSSSGVADSPDFTFSPEHQIPVITINPVDLSTGYDINTQINLEITCYGTTVISRASVVENYPFTDPGDIWSWDTSSEFVHNRFLVTGEDLSTTHIQVTLEPSDPQWTPGTEIPLQVYVDWSDATGDSNSQVLWRFTTDGTAPPPPAHPVLVTVTPNKNQGAVGPNDPVILDVIVPDDGESSIRSIKPINVDQAGDTATASYTVEEGYVLSSGHTQLGAAVTGPNHFHTSFSKVGGWTNDPTPFAYTPASEKILYPDLGVSTVTFGPFQGEFNSGAGGSPGVFSTIAVPVRSPADGAIDVLGTAHIQFNATVGNVDVPGGVFYEFKIDIDLGSGPTTVVSWVAGIITVDPDYTAVITADYRPHSFNVDLTSNEGWPSDTVITWTSSCKAFDYFYDIAGSYEETQTFTFTTEAPTFKYITLLPENLATGVLHRGEIRLVGHAGSNYVIDTGTISIDGVVVYTRNGVGSVTIHPAWQHTSSNTNKITDVHLSLIAGFDFNTSYTWAASTTLENTETAESATVDSDNFSFDTEVDRLQFILLSPNDGETEINQHEPIHIIADVVGSFDVYRVDLTVNSTLVYSWTQGTVATNNPAYATSASFTPSASHTKHFDLSTIHGDFWPDNETENWTLVVHVIEPGNTSNEQIFTINQSFIVGTNAPVYRANPVQPLDHVTGVAKDFTVVVHGEFDHEPGSFLSRSVTVDNSTIYNVIANNAPTVSPDWTVVSNTSSATRFFVQLKRNILYAFDQTVTVQTVAQVQNGITSTFTDNSTFKTISERPLELIALKPAPNDLNVASNSSIFLSFSINGGFTLTSTKILVNDKLVLDENGFKTPDFIGDVQSIAQYRSIQIQPRKTFNNNAVVKVKVIFLYQPGNAEYEIDYQFFIFSPPPTLLDPALQTTRVDRMFPPQTPNLEVLRSRLTSALRSRPEISMAVQLYSRTYASQLKALTRSLNIPTTVVKEITRILPEDTGNTDLGLKVISSLELIWDNVLRELVDLGANIADVMLINKGFRSSYPQEKLGAAATAILLGATQADQLKI